MNNEIKITKKNTEEFLKDVVFKVINAEKNKELLEKIPHRLFLDLAAIYVVRIPVKDTAIILTWHMVSNLGLTEQMLYEAAKTTMATTMESMNEVLQFIDREFSVDQCPEFIPSISLYVASNKERYFGAAALLDVEVFRKLAADVNDNLFILPSSIHEVLAVPSEGFSVYILKTIVRDINRQMVSDDEQLSDNIYWYSRETNTITIAGEEEKTAPVNTETVENCPYCECENVLTNWDVSKQGYTVKCWNCGKEIFLCDECLHADDNPKRKCDWHEEGGCGKCVRGVTHNKSGNDMQ